jgi:hypothetical protein
MQLDKMNETNPTKTGGELIQVHRKQCYKHFYQQVNKPWQLHCVVICGNGVYIKSAFIDIFICGSHVQQNSPPILSRLLFNLIKYPFNSEIHYVFLLFHVTRVLYTMYYMITMWEWNTFIARPYLFYNYSNLVNWNIIGREYRSRSIGNKI